MHELEHALLSRFGFQPLEPYREPVPSIGTRPADAGAKWQRWQVLIGEVQLAGEPCAITVFAYPVSTLVGVAGVSISLASRVYDDLDTMGEDGDKVGFEMLDQALIGFCIGVATILKASGLVMRFASEVPSFIELDSIVTRCEHPDVQALREAPWLLFGARTDRVSVDAVGAAWGPEYLVESTSGFVVVDTFRATLD
jgi:hypothetical protein